MPAWLPTDRAMRPRRRGTLAVLVAGLMLLVPHLDAQNFAIDRHTIAGGGGTSTNAQFSISGTVGQPDAGPHLSGGQFAVDGGLWNMAILVATPGTPLLSLTLLKASGTLFFSWPLSAVGYVLETTPAVGPFATWTVVSTSVQTGGQYQYVLLRPQPGIHFFRLRQVPATP